MSDTQAKAGRMVGCNFTVGELRILEKALAQARRENQHWIDIHGATMGPEWISRMSQENVDRFVLRDRLNDLIQEATND